MINYEQIKLQSQEPISVNILEQRLKTLFDNVDWYVTQMEAKQITPKTKNEWIFGNVCKIIKRLSEKSFVDKQGGT